MIARAPGKVLLAGEYSVLEGSPAVVLAVQRHAVATTGPRAALSPFLEAARHEIAERFGEDSDEAALATHVHVDSSELEARGVKLGLGSSAAATVAAIARATAARSGDAGWRDEVHLLAHRAHAKAQEPRGARGSGADIAASVHGGYLQVQRVGDDLTPLTFRRLPPLSGVLVLVWSGHPADTPTLVAAVRALRARDPVAHAAALDEIAASAADLAAGRDAVAAVARGARALAQLGARAGVPLVPPTFRAVAELAAARGGAAKPTGAGGGDLIAAVLPDREAAAAFTAQVSGVGMITLTPSVSRDGVVLAKSSNPN